MDSFHSQFIGYTAVRLISLIYFIHFPQYFGKKKKFLNNIIELFYAIRKLHIYLEIQIQHLMDI